MDRGAGDAGLLPYCRLAAGLAEYRLGHFAAAEKRLRASLAIVTRGWNRRVPADLVLAMTLQRQGRAAEALAQLTVARTIFDRDVPKLDQAHEDEWHDLLICRALRREAESILYDAGFPSDPFAGAQPR